MEAAESITGGDTTLTWEQWLERVEDMNTKSTMADRSYIDIPSAKYLEPVVAGFMGAPVAVYQGQPVMARTRKVDDISEFRTYIATLGKPVILYQTIWCSAWPAFVAMNPDTFEPVAMDPPMITESFWKIRFAIVGAEEE
jgi:hypothetical protein